jgi:hypothetical protein
MKTLAELILAVVDAIRSAPDPKAAAKRALDAVNVKAFDEAMRARRAKR